VADDRAEVRELIASTADRHRATAGQHAQSMLVGLVGRGISSSRSPRMHEREGQRLGLRYTYELVDFDLLPLPDEALAAVIAEAAVQGFSGLNVTHPFKQSIIAHLTDLAPDAAAIGAVNTVVFDGPRRVGHNTDCWGFAESMRQGLAGVSLEAVIQFGAGGGGAAVAHALLEIGTENLYIYDPDTKRASGLADRLTERFGRSVVAVSDSLAAVHRASGAVNATPVGMDKYPGVPLAAALGRRHRLFPRRNCAAPRSARPWLPHTRRHGHGDLPGHQGLRAFHRPHPRPGRDGPAFRGGRLRRRP
jgi:shikimate dehydrogenase